ncbi:MAG: NUDIX domain-containing protein [Aquificales bacterium]|nr:NUDIX domain-containing protein [Aquificales bacterium]
MKLGSNGIVINELGEILLIQRDDTRTFAPPGGGIEAGELPPDNAAREVREETGLIVHPVRLVGLYFMPWGKTGLLNFTFRCIQRGGELATSEESLQVGFYPIHKLPSPMVNFHRQRLKQSFSHDGGPPLWQIRRTGWGTRLGRLLLMQVVYRWKDWQRKRRGEPAFVPAPEWKIGAFTVIQNENDEVLWVKRTDYDAWNLPGGGGLQNEPPWETAVRETLEETGLIVHLTDLTGVYVYENEAHITLTFTANIQSGTLTTDPESKAFAWFAPGEEPENSFHQHTLRVADAVSDDEVAQFRFQPSKTPVNDRL